MITVVGMDGSALGPQAEAALAAATLVAGARRHLAVAPHQARTVVLGELAPALDALAAHDGDAVVLASGDPGFFGIVRALRGRGLKFTVLPAVSSVALAFARAGLPWDDAVVVSAHGRDPRPAVNVCRAHPKVAVLTGPGCGPAEIGVALAGWDRRLVVCEHLGHEAERITECSPARAAERTWEDPNVVLALGTTLPRAPEPSWMWDWCPSRGTSVTFMREGAVGWALGEEEFDSRDAVLTKAEVRALALARLGPGPGMLVWDVGAGSGSVAVECARFGAAVIAVERDPVRCERIRANATRHGVDVRIVPGEAPGALDGLPDPDVVFAGGGGPAVIEAVTARHPVRIVVALAAVERAGPAMTALAAAGYATDGALVQAARFTPLPGDVHRLAAANPVFLVWGTAAPGTTEHVGPACPGGPADRDTGPGTPR
jgi:precorrin-6B C5,15-methyltransferase / cobalt-precorrin-6B C5,C15-methyltransferase